MKVISNNTIILFLAALIGCQASNSTKKNSGKIDCKNDGLFFLLETIKLFLKYIVNLINKNYYSFLIQ